MIIVLEYLMYFVGFLILLLISLLELVLKVFFGYCGVSEGEYE